MRILSKIQNSMRPKKATAIVDDTFAQSNGVSVKRTGYRPFYDTSWEIGMSGGACTIVRHDTETPQRLLAEILKLPEVSIGTVKLLDQRNSIYYD